LVKTELKHDYGVHTKDSFTEHPLYHRIKFDETSIYLTKANPSSLITGTTDQGHYRTFSWIDTRAKAFLGFELGQGSPALGTASLIGTFKPEEDDLKEVKYHSFSGKAYYESAVDTLSDKPKTNTPPKLIDASSFMTMTEIIPTGVQGKAIYGQGNYIIDGAAGTGKSTTVLQKIKLLQMHENVPTDQIAIIVKSKQVTQSFSSLLESLGIEGVKLYSQSEFLESFCPNFLSIDSDLLLNIYTSVQQYLADFKALVDLNKLTTRSNIGQETNQFTLQNSDLFNQQLQSLLKTCEKYCYSRDEFTEQLAQMRKRDEKQISDFQRKFKAQLLSKKLKDLIRRDQDVSGGVNLDLGDEAKAREATLKYNKDLTDKRKRLAEENKNELDRKFSTLEGQKSRLVEALYSTRNIMTAFPSDFPVALISRYINKIHPHLASFHTVIIDEAQDMPQSVIELVRLHAKNTVLAGDESQTESKFGVSAWKNVLMYESEFSLDGKPNIFNLRHNFRQTYELGAVSFNFRQLMLGRQIEDIKQDYFDNQIGFLKPELKKIYHSNDFYNLVEDKLKYVKNKFTESFPLVIFYESESSLHRFQQLLDNKYSVCLDQSNPNDNDIMLVSTKDISGREFPVVIAPITSSTIDSTLYIMLSRAKFDLTLALSSKFKVNEYIQQLMNNELIVYTPSMDNELGW